MAAALDKPMTRRTGNGDSAEPSVDFGVLRDVLGYHVAVAAIVTVGQFDRHIGAPMGLRKVEFSLMQLLLANGPLGARRLAQTLRLSAPNLTMVLDRMQQQHWLRRERNPDDRRAQTIVLTREGEALARRAADVARQMEHEWEGRLTRAERAMLIELLVKVAGSAQ